MADSKLSSEPTEVADFDAELNMVLADSWWELGKMLSKRSNPKTLRAEIERLREGWPEFAKFLTIDAVKRFLDKAYDLLRRKHAKQNIATEARALVTSGPEQYRDAGQYLESEEARDVFWAIEYSALLGDLNKPRKGGEGWLNAAAICDDVKCPQKFFIRSRSNQSYCSYNCRMRAYGRDDYAKKRHRRSGPRKGKRKEAQ